MDVHRTIVTPDGALEIVLGTEPIDISSVGPVFRAKRLDTGAEVLCLLQPVAILACRTPTPGVVELKLDCGRGTADVVVDWRAGTFRFQPGDPARPLDELGRALDAALPPWPKRPPRRPAGVLLGTLASSVFAGTAAWVTARAPHDPKAWGALLFFGSCAALFAGGLFRRR